jgi:putative ABC transport system substrate-binding protein
MKRRLLMWVGLGASMSEFPANARAQQPAKPKLVAVLALGSPQTTGSYIDAMKSALSDVGWVEGRSIVYEVRWAEGRDERLQAQARELVALAPDLIWTGTTAAALAARQATTTIPIVVALAADPVGDGLAQSLARPGGNVTGLSTLSGEIAPKLIELLRAALPRLTRVAVLSNPSEATNKSLMQSLPAAAKSLNVTLVTVEARNPEDIERAFARMSRDAVDAVVVPGGAMFLAHTALIGQLLARYHLPSALNGRYLPGGLLSYSQNTAEAFRRSASQVDRILKGAKPADMPIEQPTKLDLVINLKSAKALGLTIPKSLLLRADEVIE